jgi:hypothetical protein
METTKPTREQILAEPPGRQLDAWVALYVMQWDKVTVDHLFDINAHPHYSTSWDDFGDVVNWMYENMEEVHLQFMDYDRIHEVTLIGKDKKEHVALSEKFEHAGCQAALLAFAEGEEKSILNLCRNCGTPPDIKTLAGGYCCIKCLKCGNNESASNLDVASNKWQASNRKSIPKQGEEEA